MEGLVRISAATAPVRTADPAYNRAQIEEMIFEAAEEGVQVIVFQELALTGAACGDLFLQDTLLTQAREELDRLVENTAGTDLIAAVGLPLACGAQVYDAAAVFSRGKILGFVPRMKRGGRAAGAFGSVFSVPGPAADLNADRLFTCDSIPGLVIGVAVGEDGYGPDSRTGRLAQAGAQVILHLTAQPALAGAADKRAVLAQAESVRLCCAYVSAGAGEGESTTDQVFGGDRFIAECGHMLARNGAERSGRVTADADLRRIEADRRLSGGFDGEAARTEDGWKVQPFRLESVPEETIRTFPRTPFVPEDDERLAQRCREVLAIQTAGLRERMKKIGCRDAVIGISGGLDSTLALLVTAQAFDELRLPRHRILAVTMPCFGTTDRTYRNACELARRLGCELREIPIRDAVLQHFADIGQAEWEKDVTYENAQARERTQVLMDLANRVGGLVVGTGDLSELALGWATYNGDHMSMYGVNATVPKTLVRALVRYRAEITEDAALSQILEDILDTPVSPELLPTSGADSEQKTEDLIGPYELHDFTLYYLVRFGFGPERIFAMERDAFAGDYTPEEILRWMKLFVRRFFTQQFKRSCVPDGPQTGRVGLSPRGGFMMPSDASHRAWTARIEAIEEALHREETEWVSD